MCYIFFLENFNIHSSTIIRTEESQSMGARFIDDKEVSSNEACMKLCCSTNDCDVFVFEEKVNIWPDIVMIVVSQWCVRILIWKQAPNRLSLLYLPLNMLLFSRWYHRSSYSSSTYIHFFSVHICGSRSLFNARSLAGYFFLWWWMNHYLYGNKKW